MAARGEVQVCLTTSDEAHVLEELGTILLFPWSANSHAGPEELASNSNAVVTVDPSRPFQTLTGFGATLTDSSAYLISQAPATVRDAILTRLFGHRSGRGNGSIGLDILRLPIGATDNSVSYEMDRVTYDATADDFGLERFSTIADNQYYLPLLHRIMAINPKVRFISSPWTAPLWMKTDSHDLGYGTLEDSPDVVLAYAQYLVKYLEDYRSKGIPIDYLTLQNEPGHGGCGPMPCMTLHPRQAEQLALKVMPLLKSSPANLTTRLLAYDHNWGPTFLESLAHVVVWIVLGYIACVILWVSCSLSCLLKPSIAKGVRAPDRIDYCDSSDQGPLLMQSAKVDHPKSSNWLACKCLVLTSAACLNIGIFILKNVYPSCFPALISGMHMGPQYPIDVLSSTAGPLFAGVAWHCYGGDASAMMVLKDNIRPRHHELEQHITECTHVGGSFAHDLIHNQRDIFAAGLNSFAKSVMFWSLALDEDFGPHCSGGSCCSDCRGVITVPSAINSIDDVAFNTEFVGLAHHSAFVGAGAQRIFSAAVGKHVHTVSYRSIDGSLVLVATNARSRGNASLTVRVKGDGSGVLDHGFSFSLPPGVATFTWRPLTGEG